MKREAASGAIIIEGHVQGLSNLRSLAELGIPLYVIDRNNCIARYSKYCKKFFKCPDFIENEFADFLIELAEKEGIKDWILLPSNDHAVITIARHKARLEVYYKVITPHLKIIENIYDKVKLLTLAENYGISIPRTYSYKSFDFCNQSEINYPVIIKGRFGLSFFKKLGKKAFLANDETKLKEFLDRIKQNNELENIIIQDMIPSDGSNKTISYTAFCEGGQIKTFWMGVKIREHPVQFGTATFAESIYIQECHNSSITLLRELNYTGVCEIEYLKDPRDGIYRLIEINARTWLWVGLAKRCGIDYAKYIYFYLHGISINFPVTYPLGIKWINYFNDTFYSLRAILKGKLKIVEYIKSLKGGKMAAIYRKDDLMPGIMFLVLVPYIIIKRG